MATDPFRTRITVDEFLKMDFGDKKVELVNGIIRAMTGGKRSNFRVQRNLLSYLTQRLRGSGCAVYGEFGLKTREDTFCYPDVAIECGRPDDIANDDDLMLKAPAVLFEILSPSTRDEDEGVKLRQYTEIASVQTVVLIDPDAEAIRVVQRLGENSWRNDLHAQAIDVDLPSLGITIPKDEIFARD